MTSANDSAEAQSTHQRIIHHRRVVAYYKQNYMSSQSHTIDDYIPVTMPLLRVRLPPATHPSFLSSPCVLAVPDASGSCSAFSRWSNPCTRTSLQAKLRNAFETCPSVDSVSADARVGAIVVEAVAVWVYVGSPQPPSALVSIEIQ
jgi:hypothetical protein